MNFLTICSNFKHFLLIFFLGDFLVLPFCNAIPTFDLDLPIFYIIQYFLSYKMLTEQRLSSVIKNIFLRCMHHFRQIVLKKNLMKCKQADPCLLRHRGAGMRGSGRKICLYLGKVATRSHQMIDSLNPRRPPHFGAARSPFCKRGTAFVSPACGQNLMEKSHAAAAVSFA
jgi:hypothetical protein